MKCAVAVTCLLALVASAHAGDLGLGGLVYAPGHASADYYAYPSYAFEYAVKDPHTGDNKAQWEKRNGDVVKGAYSLVEPDGSIRVVEYQADDKSGFNAVVKRIGPNLHPTGIAHGPIPTPIYKAPIPILESGYGPIGPISVGPIAKYSHLASAPLLTGSLLSGATSSASLIKYDSPSVKAVNAPILSELIPAPIIKSEPYVSAPYIPGPLIKSAPYLPGPIIKSAPLIERLEPLPLWPSPYSGSYLGGPDNLGVSYNLGYLGKGPLISEYGPILSGYGGYKQ